MRNKKKQIAQIVLAGGLSRRMGVLKPMLPVGGMSAVVRCIRIGEESGTAESIVVTGNGREEVEKEVQKNSPCARLVHNASYRDGMFTSVRVGAAALGAGLDGFFLLPTDCAAVSPHTLAALIEEFNKSDGNVVIRPKRGDLRGHPPLIPSRFVPALMSYSGENGMRGFLRTCPFTIVRTDDPGITMDMDTPQDYTTLLDYLVIPTYPAKAEALRLLEKYGTASHIIEHGKQVAEIALQIAKHMNKNGADINLDFLESICLLHDIARAKPNHAQAGANILLSEGYPKAASAIALHMDPSDVLISVVREHNLLFLADKLCRNGSVVSLEDTLSALETKFANNQNALINARARIHHAMDIYRFIASRFGDF